MSESCCAHHLPQENPPRIEPSSHEAPLHKHESSTKGLGRVIGALLLACVSLGFGMPHLIGLHPSPLSVGLSALSALLIVLLFGLHFLTSIRKIFRSANMNTLVGIGILAAFGLSIWNWSRGNLNQMYFDSAAFIAALVLLGQWVESLLHKRVQAQMSKLVELLPLVAHRLKGNLEEQIQISEIHVNDQILVKVGERVPVDGILVSPSASLNESIITGESRPVDRLQNSEIVQGALNVGQPFTIKVLRASQDSVYQQIVKSVQSTLQTRSPIQKTVDRIATIFVPLVVLLSAVTAYYWYHRDPFSENYISMALSVLVIACPCSLGLATPTALLVGVLRASRRGFLLKSLEAVEKASVIDLVAFDKTGTLTLGEPKVQRAKAIEHVSHKEVYQLAGSVEVSSEHPYAQAIKKKCAEENVNLLPADDIHIAPGKGVRGRIKRDGKLVEICVGNLVWLYENDYDSTQVPADLLWDVEGTHETSLWVGQDKKILGVIFLEDQLRPKAKEVVQSLADEGYQVGMITGDSDNVAKHFAKELNFKFYHAGVLPQEKATIVKRLSQPKKKGMDMITEQVAFVGDGVNDAPALAQAKLGLAMGSGAAISQTTADLVLLSNDLSAIPSAFKVLNQTRGLITQNLLLGFAYNIIAIPVAAGVLYPSFQIALNPGIAAVAMGLSSLSVLLNSLRVLKQ